MLQPGLQPCLWLHFLLFLTGARGWTLDVTYSLATPEVVSEPCYQHLVLSAMIRPHRTVPLAQPWSVLELFLTPSSDVFVGLLFLDTWVDSVIVETYNL